MVENAFNYTSIFNKITKKEKKNIFNKKKKK